MKKLYFLLTIASVLLSFLLSGQSGPFAPPAGQPGSTAIHKDSSDIVCWATGIELHRGYRDISNPGTYASYGVPSKALHKAEGGSMDVVSLGDGGVAILTFDRPIVNGPGNDFAVFENGFSDDFLELAFVEVSSDGERFVRFPSVSLTQTIIQVDSYESLDATNIHNLAGKYKESYGTPFDLDDIADSTGIDLNNIRFVKIIDVVGCIQDEYATYDSQGNKVNDPWPTPFESGGFDLDGVAVMNAGPFYRISDMNDLSLDPDSFWNGADESGSFISNGVEYYNSFNPTYQSWSGFSYSNMRDDTTAGFTNQFSAITRGGMDAGPEGGTNYAVAYVPMDWMGGTYEPIPIEMTFEDGKPHVVNGFYTVNNTYATLSMLFGDSFAKKFGGPTGNDPDWFTLNVFGIDENNNSTDTVVFYLADYRFDDNSLDYIVKDWTWVDLEHLGPVNKLMFFVNSSDAGDYGINTPAYFCLENLTYKRSADDDNPPYVANAIDDIVFENMIPITLDVSNVFADPDGDPITIEITGNSNPELISLVLENNNLEITPLKEEGNCVVELTATANGLSVSHSFNVNVTLGVEDVLSLIDVYPNPSNGIINIDININSLLKVIDLSGRVVYENTITKGLNSIDISFLAKGTYILNVTNDDITINHKIIIK